MADWFTPNYDWFKGGTWVTPTGISSSRASAQSADFDQKRNDYELGKGLEVLRAFGEESMITQLGGETLTFAQSVQAGGKGQNMILLLVGFFVFFYFVTKKAP